MKKENTSKRYRNFATVVYPESAPECWQDALSDFHIPVLISPLHDKDFNPTGEPKKPHYHVMILFDGVKTTEQAKEIFDFIGGVGCEVVNSIRGYARYLCHLDNPEKAQYSVEDVICLSGADFFGVINLAIDKYKAIREMCEFCVENRIVEYADLCDYAMVNKYDWWRMLCDCASMQMRNYLASKRHKVALTDYNESVNVVDVSFKEVRKDSSST